MSGLVMKPQQLLSLASKLLNRPERSAVVVKVAAYLNRNPLVDISDVTCARNPLILVLDNVSVLAPNSLNLLQVALNT